MEDMILQEEERGHGQDLLEIRSGVVAVFQVIVPNTRNSEVKWREAARKLKSVAPTPRDI